MEIKLLNSTKVPPTVGAVGVVLAEEQKPTWDNSVSEIVTSLLEGKQFQGKDGEMLVTYVKSDEDYLKLILVGAGAADKLSNLKLRKAVGKIVNKAKELKVEELFMVSDLRGQVKDLAPETLLGETVKLAAYKFDKYLSEKKENPIKTVYVVGENEDALQEGVVLGEAGNIARELTATSANELTPVELANRVQAYGKEYGFDVEIHDEKKIQRLGMEAYWQVSKGSDNPPRLIVMRHNGDKKSKDITALVGKGMTFDSGGLSIKSSDGMMTMKTDMAGAAAVVGAMAAIAKRKLAVNVVGVIAASENMPSGKAYRPGDIIGSMAGKTIHVGSTDAEGRLTLADAVHYAVKEERASRVIDLATLTGACVAALGAKVSAVLATDEDFYARFAVANTQSDELIWRMPTFDHYKEAYKHPEADLNNVGEGGGGAITGGLFIGEFVDNVPWIHVDIAGKAYTKEDNGYIVKGPTGVGARPLYHLVKSYGK